MLKASVADEVASMLSTVVTQGTATRAQIPDTFVAGKTGTTENYGDAWFVGWTDKITVAVWVGYPDELRPMETEFNGQPVAGGTYPAAIWKSFVEQRAATTRSTRLTRSADEDDGPDLAGADRADDPGRAGAGDDGARAGHDAPSGEGGGAEPPADPAPQEHRAGRRRRRTSSRPPSRSSRRPRSRRRRRAAPRRRSSSRALRGPPQPGRPRPRHAARPDRAEAPRQLGRLRDPDARAGDDLDVLPAGRPRADPQRAARRGRCRCARARSRAPG